MQFEARLVAADDDEVVDIGESAQPLSTWSGIVLPGFDSVRLATLHALITGESLQLAMDQYEPIYVSSEDVAVYRVADELLESLVELDDEATASVAEELALTEERERKRIAMYLHDQIAQELLAARLKLGEVSAETELTRGVVSVDSGRGK